MQAQTTSRQPSSFLAWMVAVFGVILMVLLLLSFMADSQRPTASDAAPATTSQVAYLQFGLAADSLRVTESGSHSQSREVLSIPHAAEYGVLPSISPDGAQFAYTVLPEGLTSPNPSSPAELWVTSIEAPEPRLLAEGVDLLVPPVWTPDGESVVYRRSEGSTHTLALKGVNAGDERPLTSSDDDTLFPVAFTGDGALLYVSLNADSGSRLHRFELDRRVQAEVASLSPGLTREWSVSPDGSRIAFLEIALTESQVASRASVFDLNTNSLTPATSVDEAAFGPIWTDDGRLAVGTFNQVTQDASLLVIDADNHSRIPGPEAGFDVPLAFDTAANAFVASSFENDSITSPGRSVLTLVGMDGERTTIAEGEVTLVGWTHP